MQAFGLVVIIWDGAWLSTGFRGGSKYVRKLDGNTTKSG